MLRPDAYGCELGVFRCEFSDELVESGRFKSFVLVDPFIGDAQGNIGSGDKDGLNHRVFHKTELFQHAVDWVHNQKEGTFRGLHLEKSVDFLTKHFEWFDFVYIDTTHIYEDTLAELNAAWGATRKGGVIAGHDFNLKGAGVKKAVDEFCYERGLEYFVVDGDGLHSFYFFKL